MRLVLMILGLLLTTVSVRAESMLVLRSAADVAGPAIRLSDVFSGLTPTQDRDIAVAPQPGKSVTYDARILARLAEQYRLSWQPQNLTDKAVLTRASVAITSDMIRNAVIAKLAEAKLNGTPDIQFDRRDLELLLPVDQTPDFTLNNFSYDSVAKRFRADLVTGPTAAPISRAISGRVSLKRDVPVLTNPLTAGSIIGNHDIVWLTLPEERIQNDMATNAAQLIGSAVKRDVAEGQVIRLRDVMPPRLVTRGSLVTLKVETSLLQVTAQGRALQDGAKGDVIRITNTQSNRMVEGVVEGPGLVRIMTAPRAKTEG
jgi:flagella basal body P-ring formation protein FlgA